MSPCFVLSVKLDHGADGVVVGIEESLGIFVGNNVGGDAFRVGEDVVDACAHLAEIVEGEGKHRRVAQSHVIKKLVRVIFRLETSDTLFNPDLIK